MSTLVAATPFPGLDTAGIFELTAVDGAQGLYSLESAQVAGLRLFVLDADLHLPEYNPVFTDAQRTLVGEPDAADRSVLVVVNTADQDPTVNLLAPILINDITGYCAQVILEGQDWDLRAPLPA